MSTLCDAFRKSGIYPLRREHITDDLTRSSLTYSSSSAAVTWKVVESNHDARQACVPEESTLLHQSDRQCLMTHSPAPWCKKAHKVCQP